MHKFRNKLTAIGVLAILADIGSVMNSNQSVLLYPCDLSVSYICPRFSAGM